MQFPQLPDSTSPKETTMKRILLAGTAALTVFAALPLAYALNPQPLPPSPEWAQSLPTGPVSGTKITEEYARHVARDAVFWAWPLVNVYNRRLTYEKVPEIMMAGPVPAGPPNHLGMLTNYIVPEERIVACPNQDVVYGNGALALDKSPVVIPVPGLPDRRRPHRQLRRPRQDVRFNAGLLSARRSELERRGAEGHHQGVSRLDEYRLRRAARLPG